MRRAALALIAAIALAGCKAKVSGPLDLTLPIQPIDRSAIIVIEDPAMKTIEVDAIDIARSGTVTAIKTTLDRDHKMKVTALFYDRTLAQNRIVPGRIAIETTGWRRPIPASTRIFESAINGDQAGPWASMAATSTAIAALRIHGFVPCIRFSAEANALGTLESSKAAIGADVPSPPTGFSGHGVLVVTGRSGAVYLERGGTPRPLITPEGQPCGSSMGPVQFEAAFRAQRALWFGTDCGHLYSGNIDLGNNMLAAPFVGSVMHRDTIFAIAGPINENPVSELFTLETGGYYDRFDALKDDAADIDGFGDGRGALIYSQNGEGFAVWNTSAKIDRYKDGAQIAEAISSTVVVSGFVAATHADDVGDLIASSNDRLFRRTTDRGWVQLILAHPPRGIRALAPYQGTFLLLESGGTLRQYSTDTGDLCAPYVPLQDKPDDAIFIAISGDDIALVGNPVSPENWVRWLVPEDHPE